jgi:hypothetical protein
MVLLVIMKCMAGRCVDNACLENRNCGGTICLIQKSSFLALAQPFLLSVALNKRFALMNSVEIDPFAVLPSIRGCPVRPESSFVFSGVEKLPGTRNRGLAH